MMDELDHLFNEDIIHLDNESLPITNLKRPGAENIDILNIKNHFNITLPDEYLNFLKYTNGCTLFNYKDLGGYIFFAQMRSRKKIFY